MEGTASEPDLVVVPSRGLRLYPWVLRLAFILLIGVELWLDFAVIGVPSGNSWLLTFAFAFPVGSMAFADLLLVEYFSNLRIEISSKGILAVYKFHRTFAAWYLLVPLDSGLLGQSGFLFDRGKGKRTQLILTYEQLRAVAAFPASPKWVFPPRVAVHLQPASSA